MKNRFKVIVKDRITGEKTIYKVHSDGYYFNAKYTPNETDKSTPEVIKIVMDFPKVKRRNKNVGG